MRTEEFKQWQLFLMAACVPIQGLMGMGIISVLLGSEAFPNAILGMILWSPIFTILWVLNEEE